MTKSISVIAKGSRYSRYNNNFTGLQLYKSDVRTNSDYRICTSYFLCHQAWDDQGLGIRRSGCYRLTRGGTGPSQFRAWVALATGARFPLE